MLSFYLILNLIVIFIFTYFFCIFILFLLLYIGKELSLGDISLVKVKPEMWKLRKEQFYNKLKSKIEIIEKI